MADAGPGVVDPFGVAKGYVLHDPGEGNFANLHDEVYVVRHETKAVDPAAELFADVL
jgi:hypothetical protein